LCEAETRAGESYVIFGKTGSTAIELSAIASGTGGFVINGENTGDQSSVSLSNAGDVNEFNCCAVFFTKDDIGLACVYFTAWIGSISTNNQIIQAITVDIACVGD
jgi:hypothetical protein